MFMKRYMNFQYCNVDLFTEYTNLTSTFKSPSIASKKNLRSAINALLIVFKFA